MKVAMCDLADFLVTQGLLGEQLLKDPEARGRREDGCLPNRRVCYFHPRLWCETCSDS